MRRVAACARAAVGSTAVAASEARAVVTERRCIIGRVSSGSGLLPALSGRQGRRRQAKRQRPPGTAGVATVSAMNTAPDAMGPPEVGLPDGLPCTPLSEAFA